MIALTTYLGLTYEDVTPSGAIAITAIEKNGGAGYCTISAGDATAISSGWVVCSTRFTVSGTGNSDFDGTHIYLGISSNRIVFYPPTGGSSALTSVNATAVIYRHLLTVPYAPGNGDDTPINLLAGSFLCGPQDATNYTGSLLSDCFIRPTHETHTALWIGLTNPGADTGFPFGIGIYKSQGWHWGSDGHSLKRYMSNYQHTFQNYTGDYHHPFFWITFASRNGQSTYTSWGASGGNVLTVAVGLEEVTEGVLAVTGSTQGTNGQFRSGSMQLPLVSAASVATPPSGYITLFADSATGALATKNSLGNTTPY